MTPPLHPRHGLPCRDLVVVYLDQFLTVRHDPSSVAHQAHGPEEIPLDHERVEPCQVPFGVAPMQHEVVPDRGSKLIRHDKCETSW